MAVHVVHENEYNAAPYISLYSYIVLVHVAADCLNDWILETRAKSHMCFIVLIIFLLFTILYVFHTVHACMYMVHIHIP